MLSFLQQNVGKMEPSIEKLDDRKDAWVYWGTQDMNAMKCKLPKTLARHS